MTGDGLDPDRARAARDVARMHPAMVALVLGVPTVAAVGLVWWLLGPGTAVLMVLAAVIFGGWSLLRKRRKY
ncbi:MAG: PEP-CTERM sorting domain-containing protein [Mycolicibacterium aromaticivorans]|nr:PEP-CTERM sorting domain-containing protein [Mycolicibacterium aromaticivorans]